MKILFVISGYLLVFSFCIFLVWFAGVDFGDMFKRGPNNAWVGLIISVVSCFGGMFGTDVYRYYYKKKS